MPPLVFPSRVSVRRADDFLVCDLVFVGFTFHEGPPRLERATENAHIIVDLPPQSFGEQAYLEVAKEVSIEPAPPDKIEVSSHPGYPDKNVNGGDEPTPPELPAARVRMSGRSRVAISMPAATNVIAFDLPSMLAALRDWPMRLDFNAAADPPDPSLIVSGIESVFDQIATEPGTAPAAASVPGGATPGALSEIDLSPIRPFLLGPHEPAAGVTALELPYRLVVSPLDPAGWQHSSTPVAHHGRTELWHTRLTTARTGTGVDEPGRVRALWSPDYRPPEQFDELIRLVSDDPDAEPPDTAGPNPNLLRMSLDPVDRSMLVTLMSGYDATRNGGEAMYRPLSSEAKRLHLTALGALIDVEGTWTTLPDGVDLQQWRHLGTLGRDHYVRVVYAGYLCPFGHAASLVKVTERKFQSMTPDASERVALLRQRFFIVVRQPVRDYGPGGHKYALNNFPFRRVEILTTVTPDLSEPGSGDGYPRPSSLAPRMLFWPMVPASSGSADVAFHVAATDLAGERVTFSMPLLFVGKLADDSHGPAVIAGYNASPAARRQTSLGGAVVAYAPFTDSDEGDPRLPSESITFQAGNAVGFKVAPKFHPEIALAAVGIKPIQKLLGQKDFIAEVAYPDFYRDHAFAAAQNKGQIFLKLTKSKRLSFGGDSGQAKSDAIGALASPEMNLLGLSRILGPVSGEEATAANVEAKLGEIRSGTFNPVTFFKDAKILGGITLADILGTKFDLSGSDVPKLLARDFADRTEASFYWSTDISGPDKVNLLIPRADSAKPPTRLTMEGVVRTPFDPKEGASYSATAALNNFKINLFGFIILWFEQLTFVAANGKKPDVAVELRNGDKAVQFGGPLEFVNSLRKYIPSNGFSDPPSLQVTPSGISASYSLTLPAIEVGIFALSNLSLGAGFNLPFDARPASVKFAFSERQQPFSLTVSLLGGGGFFAIGVSAEGVNEIEAALEFGAVVAINLGVASGSVEIKAGIYFHWLQPFPDKKGSVELAGYVRIHGELTVIAIISVSLTFNLQLGYVKAGGKGTVYGEATLTVEIDILMFSVSVSVSCRREFDGGPADPKFIELIPTPQVWTEYCESFASEATS